MKMTITEKILATAMKMKERSYYKKLTIAISLDGIGEVHDGIRGIPGAYDKVLETARRLKEIGFDNIGFGFTFMSGNEEEYRKVYDLSQELGINFGVSLAHNSDNYFSTEENLAVNTLKLEDQINSTINEKIKTYSKNELGKCYYLHGLVEFAKKS